MKNGDNVQAGVDTALGVQVTSEAHQEDGLIFGLGQPGAWDEAAVGSPVVGDLHPKPTKSFRNNHVLAFATYSQLHSCCYTFIWLIRWPILCRCDVMWVTTKIDGTCGTAAGRWETLLLMQYPLRLDLLVSTPSTFLAPCDRPCYFSHGQNGFDRCGGHVMFCSAAGAVQVLPSQMMA